VEKNPSGMMIERDLYILKEPNAQDRTVDYFKRAQLHYEPQDVGCIGDNDALASGNVKTKFCS